MSEAIPQYIVNLGVAGVMLFIWATELRDIKNTLKEILKVLNGKSVSKP